MFCLSQGVPVMAIKNKMVLEGLDPNLLEWVFYCYLVMIFYYLFMTLTNNVSFAADDSTPDAPLPDGGRRSAEDQDVAANSSDSESSFSDWRLSPWPAKLPVKATHIATLRKRSRSQGACKGVPVRKVQM